MPSEIIPYNPSLKELARELRNNPTPPEKHLWRFLRRRQIQGLEFHRQVPIDQFIVDFYCHELRLAIEIDGSSHENAELEDGIRQKKIESFGVAFLRFENQEVMSKTEWVLQEITKWIKGGRE